MKTGSKKTNSNKKHRCIELENQTQYIAHLINCPEDDVPIALAKMLDGLDCVENYALILHGKDFDDKGEPAEPHVHCVMEFKYPITITTISNHLGIEPQYFELIKQKKPLGHTWVTDIGGGLSYLTHRNVTNKHGYSDDEVIANAGWDWKAERNKSEEIQRKLKVENIIRHVSLIARLGRAFGIRLILSTQRPDSNVLPGQIKNNLEHRICGRADSVLSGIILDNTEAAKQISSYALGRFVTKDGTIFQGFRH